MDSVSYNEELLTTTNTKLAAILLIFGVKLREHSPWNRIGPRQVAFNFEVREVGKEKIQRIIEAFESEEKDFEFRKTLGGLSPQQRLAILAAHSRVTARMCRECLEAREYLVDLIFSVSSSNSKWDHADIN